MHNNRNNNAKYVMRDSDSLTPVFQNKYLLFNLAWRDLNDLSGFKLRPSSFTGLSKENSCPAIDCKNAYKMNSADAFVSNIWVSVRHKSKFRSWQDIRDTSAVGLKQRAIEIEL